MNSNSNNLKRKSFYKNICGIGIILLGIIFISIFKYKSKEEVMLSFNSDLAMYIAENETVSISEYLIYAASVTREATETYGEDVWKESVSIGDDKYLTFEEYTRRQICEQIKMTHMLNSVADKYGVFLSEEELIAISSDAEKYSNLLKDIDTAEIGIDLALILKVYKENAVAEKVYHSILDQVEKADGMSDDEYEEACYTFFDKEYDKISKIVSPKWSYESFVNIEEIGAITFAKLTSKEIENDDGADENEANENEGLTYDDIKDFELVGKELEENKNN